MKAHINSTLTRSWTDSFSDNKEIERRLFEEGYTHQMIAEFKKEYDEIRTGANKLADQGYFKDPAFYEETRRRESMEKSIGRSELAYYKGGAEAKLWWQYITNAVSNFLDKVEHKVEDTIDIEVKFPLFKLHSPRVKGSKVVYEESQTEATKGSYNLTIFGTGLGETKDISFTNSSTFTSTNGSYKLIYAIGIIRSALIGIYKKGELVSKGLRTEVVVDKDHELGIGIDTIKKEEYYSGFDIKQTKGKQFKLSGDYTDTTQSFKESWKVTSVYKHTAGIKAFNIDTKCEAEIKQVKDVSLKFSLPSGHDYELIKVFDGYGIVWV